MAQNAFDRVRPRIEEIILQSPFPEDVFHAINTLEWVERLVPDAGDALRIAALGHDIERGMPDRMVHATSYGSFDEYKQAHALNCAEILVELLESEGIDQNIIDDVAHLVAHHEIGGDDRETALKDADVLSFFQVSLPLYFDRRGPETTRKRSVWGYSKLSGNLKKEVRDMEFLDEDLRELVLESIGADGVRHSDPE